MIFVHSGFRTGSTYVWSCFRKAPRTIAYYEIFNDALAELRADKLAGMRPDVWNSKHPVSAPYFLEFLPLIGDVGVTGFEPAMSYQRFIPAQGCCGAVSEAEVSYLRSLIDHAEARGRIPVLTSTRSLGRLRGLKDALPGLHILLYRNVFQQWCSFTEQAFGGNNYFIERMSRVVQLNLHDRTLRELNTMFPVESPSYDDPNTFFVFLFLHLHLYAQSAGGADVVMDVNRLAADRSYRTSIEDQIGAQDVPIDLSGAGNSIAYSLCAPGSLAEVQERLRVLGEMVIDRAPDAAGRHFGSKVLEELLEEYARHEFYAGGMRSILMEAKGVRAEHETPRRPAEAPRELVAADRTTLVLTHAPQDRSSEGEGKQRKQKRKRRG